MLRRAESVSVRFVRDHRFSHYGEIRVLLGRDQTVIGWGHRDEFQRAAVVHQTRPQFVVRAGERNYWQFRGRFFWDNDELEWDEIPRGPRHPRTAGQGKSPSSSGDLRL